MQVRPELRVFLYGLGYFACYVPYAALTKALTSASMTGEAATSGMRLVPVSTAVSMVAMVAFLVGSGFYRATVPIGGRLPRLRPAVVLSGVATAVILVTTTLSYTFASSSVPFVMVLMRGGVLLIAPFVDVLTGRKIAWYSGVALAMGLGAIVLVISGEGDGELPTGLLVVLGLYLAGYLARLTLMSRLAKSDDAAAGRRFFAEEQLVASPTALAMLGILALVWPGDGGAELRAGFSLDLSHPLWTVVVGLCSQGTGIFGALLLLDAREASYCVPINRAASIVAGLVSGATLAWVFGVPLPSLREALACSVLITSVLLLYWGPRLGAPKKEVR